MSTLSNAVSYSITFQRCSVPTLAATVPCHEAGVPADLHWGFLALVTSMFAPEELLWLALPTC